MYEDDFGCLHTKDIFGHKMRVYPFAKKYPFTCLCSAQCGLIVPLWLRTTFGGKKAFFPRSLQQGPKGAQRMMKGCSKVAYAFVTLLITYSSAANSFTTLYVHPPCILRLHLFSSLQRLAYLMPYIIAQPPVSWLSPFLSPI